MNTVALAPGDTTYADFYSPHGSLLIHARIDHHGTHTTITVAHTDELNKQFASNRDADTYLTWLQDQVEAGVRLYDIVQAAGVYTSVQAVFDEIAAQVVEAPASLDAYRQNTTRTGAPTSEPMDRVLAQADERGYILRGKTATSTQLVALKRRGKVELDYRTQGRTRYIAGAWLAGHKPEQVAA